MTIGLQAYLQGYMHDKTAEDSFLDSPEYKEWADNRQAKYPGAGEIDFDFDDPEHPLYTGVEDKDMDVANDFSDVFKYKSGPKWARPSRGRSDYHIRAAYMEEQKKHRERRKPQIEAARKKMTPAGVASDRYNRGEIPLRQYEAEAGSK